MNSTAVSIFKKRLKTAADAAVTKKVMAVFTKLGPEASLKEFKMGLEVEKEHGPTGPMGGMFDITHGDTVLEAKIAAAHLAELPDYYTRLKRMEAEGENNG